MTQPQILDAIHRWAAQYGEPPARIDWEPHVHRRTDRLDRLQRFDAGGWPTARIVERRVWPLQ